MRAFFNKRLPGGIQAFQHYPLHNPVMITVEPQSWRWICRLKGCCLLCPYSAEEYDLSLCFAREVWVLYSRPQSWAATVGLAQAVQQSGAVEITIIRLGK
jgi:hypothetical protein